MGNCWVSFSKEANTTTPSTTTIHGPTSPGVSTNTSHSKEISATRSTGKSQFSDTVNEDGETATAGEQILETPNLKIFSFADLKLAAKNFKSDRVIGEGVSGKVYLGWIDEKTFSPSKSGVGMVVAIKKLSPEGTQGFLEWQIEDNFPARLSHPTLVKLFGYCREDKELLLVYEFMQNGTLDKQLFRRDPSIEPLSWDTRLKIATGAARGLVFLHISKERVIYRDFRTSSILLDGSFNAKLGNFGLAKLGPTDGESHVTTRVMGTYGYVAPEYLTTGHLYVQSDVYSFGVVLLEMLTGLMVFDTKRPRGEQNLVDWMKPMLSQKKKLKDIMDRRIEGQYSTEAARKAAQLALKCLNLYPKRRPSMTEVLEILEHVEAMK